MIEIKHNVQNEPKLGNKPVLPSRLFKFRFFDTELNKMCYRNPLTYDFCCKTIVPMQFTGLYDKNGKEIYESDIIIYDKIKGLAKIIFEKGSFSFYGSSTIQFLFNVQKNEIEIIGNIFEKPKT